MNKEDLLKLIADDEFGILKVKPKQSAASSADERLIASFEEINKFIDKHENEPQAGKGIQEHQLYARLKGIRENKEKSAELQSIDEHGLLKQEITFST